jgi:hypothetical protein
MRIGTGGTSPVRPMPITSSQFLKAGTQMRIVRRGPELPDLLLSLPDQKSTDNTRLARAARKGIVRVGIIFPDPKKKYFCRERDEIR